MPKTIRSKTTARPRRPRYAGIVAPLEPEPELEPVTEPVTVPLPPSPRIEKITLTSSGAAVRAVRVGNGSEPVVLTADLLRQAVQMFLEARAQPEGCVAFELQKVVMECSLAPLVELCSRRDFVKRLAFLDGTCGSATAGSATAGSATCDPSLDGVIAAILRDVRGVFPALEEFDLSSSSPTDEHRSASNFLHLLKRMPYLQLLRLNRCARLGKLVGHNLALFMERRARQSRPLILYYNDQPEGFKLHFSSKMATRLAPLTQWIYAAGDGAGDNLRRHWESKGAGLEPDAVPASFRFNAKTCTGYLRERPGDAELELPPGTVHRLGAFRVLGNCENPLLFLGGAGTTYVGEPKRFNFELHQWIYQAETAAFIARAAPEDREFFEAVAKGRPVRTNRADLERRLKLLLPAVFGECVFALEAGAPPPQEACHGMQIRAMWRQRASPAGLPAPHVPATENCSPSDPYWILFVVRKGDLLSRTSALAGVMAGIPEESEALASQAAEAAEAIRAAAPAVPTPAAAVPAAAVPAADIPDSPPPAPRLQPVPRSNLVSGGLGHPPQNYEALAQSLGALVRAQEMLSQSQGELVRLLARGPAEAAESRATAAEAQRAAEAQWAAEAQRADRKRPREDPDAEDPDASDEEGPSSPSGPAKKGRCD